MQASLTGRPRYVRSFWGGAPVQHAQQRNSLSIQRIVQHHSENKTKQNQCIVLVLLNRNAEWRPENQLYDWKKCTILAGRSQHPTGKRFKGTECHRGLNASRCRGRSAVMLSSAPQATAVRRLSRGTEAGLAACCGGATVSWPAEGPSPRDFRCCEAALWPARGLRSRWGRQDERRAFQIADICVRACARGHPERLEISLRRPTCMQKHVPDDAPRAP